MAARDIIVIGASAGGVDPLQLLVQKLPQGLAAAVFVVMHVVPDSPGLLAALLDRAGPLPAVRAEDGMRIEHGRIYVAPPDRHLALEPERVRVIDGPRDNLHRPSIDTLFRSAAAAFERRVIGVVLSGALDDGTAGLAAIKRRGGVAMVQDPDQAAFPGMPASALAHVAIDHCGTIEALALLIARLVREPLPPASSEEAEAPNLPSMLTCPECTGSLWETDDRGVLRYRCHVGHRFTSETLLAGQHETRERALWAAVRALEQAMLARRIAERARERGLPASAERFEKMAALHADQASQIRMIAAEQPRAVGVP